MFRFRSNKSTKQATKDGSNNFKFLLINSNHQTLKIRQKNFGPKFFIGFLFFDDWIWLRDTKNDWNWRVFLTLSILNGPEEAAVNSREVGGKDLTYNALLREGKPRFSNQIHRFAQKQNLNKLS